MQTREFVEFKKERDLGAIISDAFKFIRLEWKSFFKVLLTYAAIPILLVLASFYFYMTSISGLMNTGNFNNVLQMAVPFLVLIISSVLAFTLINLSGMYYIKSYIDNKGIVNQEEINTNIKQNFVKFLGYGVLATILLFFSIMLCIIPVFYTMTVLSIGTSILVYQNQSATAAISNSFGFVNSHFWPTFGTIIVVGILVSILGYVFQIPTFIYQVIKMGTFAGSNDPTEVFSLFSDPIYLALNAIAQIANYLFYAVTLITNVFLYFDINEKTNATGALEKIESLGEA